MSSYPALCLSESDDCPITWEETLSEFESLADSADAIQEPANQQSLANLLAQLCEITDVSRARQNTGKDSIMYL